MFSLLLLHIFPAHLFSLLHKCWLQEQEDEPWWVAGAGGLRGFWTGHPFPQGRINSTKISFCTHLHLNSSKKQSSVPFPQCIPLLHQIHDKWFLLLPKLCLLPAVSTKLPSSIHQEHGKQIIFFPHSAVFYVFEYCEHSWFSRVHGICFFHPRVQHRAVQSSKFPLLKSCGVFSMKEKLSVDISENIWAREALK